MHRYVARRLVLFIPTLVGATLAIFLLLRVLPGDVALVILAGGGEREGRVTEEALESLRARLGTDRPLHEQYIRWTVGMLRLDFGRSMTSDRPVADELKQRLPVTFQLATMSIVGAALLGIPLGVVMALRRNMWLDYILRAITIGGVAIPTFFAAIVVILVLLSLFNWIPPLGFSGPFEDPVTNLQQVLFAVLIMSYSGSVVVARLTRSAMLDVLSADYVVTARSKGLAEPAVMLRHALKNALPVSVTFLGTVYIDMLNGVVVLEKIFVLPGIGSGLVDSISDRDYPMVEGTLAVLIVIVLVTNLILDVLHARLDPRVALA